MFALLAGISAGIGSATYRLTGLRGVWGIGVQSLSQALNQSLEVQNHDALVFAIGIWAQLLQSWGPGPSARDHRDRDTPVSRNRILGPQFWKQTVFVWVGSKILQ